MSTCRVNGLDWSRDKVSLVMNSCLFLANSKQQKALVSISTYGLRISLFVAVDVADDLVCRMCGW